MMASVYYRIAADLVLGVHASFVLFVVVGLVLILVGGLRGWRWVRNPWFRVGHLLAIGFVVAQAWLGAVCPLTILEMTLRSRAGDAVYSGSFIAHWVEILLYYEAPLWVFATCYSTFGLLVVMSWIIVRPRPLVQRRGQNGAGEEGVQTCAWSLSQRLGRDHDVRWNVPNVLSTYRLAVVPVVLGTIVMGYRDVFFVLICVSLVTDILDGWIARHYHLETEFGARLDSLADNATSFTAFLGIVVLEREFVVAHLSAVGVLLAFKVIPPSVSLWRFGRLTSLHLYSSKAAGYVQGFFIFGYFVFGYTAWYFYFTIGFCVLASVEKLVILWIVPELQSNMRGLYWVLRRVPARN